MLAVIFTDHLAVKNPAQALTYAGISAGPGKPNEELDIIGPGINSASLESRSLWINLVPGEDWFVSATYTPAGGAAIVLPKAKCRPVPDSAAVPDNCTRVSVDVTGLPAGTGRPDGQARYDSEADFGLSDCVMYGAANAHQSFCENCAPAVIKVDLSAGWTRF